VHTMQVKVQKAALPEGDRALPVAGLLFFLYHGRNEQLKSVELIYSGPAGKATVTLQPYWAPGKPNRPRTLASIPGSTPGR